MRTPGEQNVLPAGNATPLKSFIIIVHFLEIVAIWLSPFLVTWWLIIIGIAAYALQLLILGDCFMTRWQFGNKKRGPTFYYFLLVKMGFSPDMQRVRFIADYIMPPVILGLALVWQLALNNKPLVI